MSQETTEAGRSVEERVLLRLPTPVVGLLCRGLWRLPPGSHLRRRMLKRSIARGFEAVARDDYAIPLLSYEMDVEIRYPGGGAARALGLPERYEGHQGFLDFWRDWKQDMDEARVQPERIIDLGDRVVMTGTFSGRGRASGVLTSRRFGTIYYVSPRGLIARQDVHDQADTLRAAGLSE
jgi:ketosteroid isomerase-like protein